MRILLLLSTLILGAFSLSLSAQITKEQADEIVKVHLDTELTEPYILYFNTNSPSEEGIEIKTTCHETVTIKYACWAYFLYESEGADAIPRCRYLFVKEDSGSLLELITTNDLGPDDMDIWKTQLGMVDGMGRTLLPYPNPVSDILTIPGTGSSMRVEIYDLRGTLILSEILLEQDTNCLNISSLDAGIYVLSVYGETGTFNYKFVKN